MDCREADRLLESYIRGLLYWKDEDYMARLRLLGWSEAEAYALAAWDWPHGVGIYCLYKKYVLTKDLSILDYIENWYRRRISEGLPPKNVNTVAPLIALVSIYPERPSESFKAVILEWAEWIMNEMPRTKEGGIQHQHAELENHSELWDDTLLMTVLFLAKAGRVLSRKDYEEEAIYQVLLHSKYLVDRPSGLWYHAWCFDRGDNYAEALWGRGNAWVMVFLPEFLETVDPGDGVRRFLESLFLRQAESLRETQDESGLWHTLINDPSSYLETSCSSGFFYGIMKGVRLGILGKEYLPCCARALPALLSKIGPDGKVNGVSYGTNVGLDLDHYRNIEIRQMPYGQGLMMLAVQEALAAEKEGLI